MVAERPRSAAEVSIANLGPLQRAVRRAERLTRM